MVLPCSSVALAELVPGCRRGALVGGSGWITSLEIGLPSAPVTVRVLVPSALRGMLVVVPSGLRTLPDVPRRRRGTRVGGSGRMTSLDIGLPSAPVTVRVLVPSGFRVMVVVVPSGLRTLPDVPRGRGAGRVGGGGSTVPRSISLPSGPVTVRVVVPLGCFSMVTVLPCSSTVLAEVRGPCGFLPGLVGGGGSTVA